MKSEPKKTVILEKKKDNETTKIKKNSEKKMKSGLWKALDETAKITKIAKFCKAVDENQRRNANGRPLSKLRKLRESRKIVNFAEEFNLGHKWWSKTTWSKVSCVRKQHNGRDQALATRPPTFRLKVHRADRYTIVLCS